MKAIETIFNPIEITTIPAGIAGNEITRSTELTFASGKYVAYVTEYIGGDYEVEVWNRSTNNDNAVDIMLLDGKSDIDLILPDGEHVELDDLTQRVAAFRCASPALCAELSIALDAASIVKATFNLQNWAYFKAFLDEQQSALAVTCLA